MTTRVLSRAFATLRVETLLLVNPSRLFAAISELDWYSLSHRQWIDEQDFSAGDRVLEVGCGTGALTAYMTDSGWRATGLDRSRDMIRRARRAHPQLDLRVGDASSLPDDDSSFDAVVAASVVNVVADAEAILSEMRRVCSPDGTVSVLVPSTDFTDDDLDALVETLGLRGFSLAALTKWHRTAPKTSRPQLETLFRGVDLDPVVTQSYLEGMLLAVTATAR